MSAIETACGRFWLSGQSTSSAFATKIDRQTAPSGSNVYDLGVERLGAVPNLALITALGVGANNTTFDFRVWGWANNIDPTKGLGFKEFWHPTLLGGFSATLSSSLTGALAGLAVPITTYYADTLTLKTLEGTANVSNEIVSGALDTFAAYVALDIRGFALLEFEFDMTGATSGGVLVKLY